MKTKLSLVCFILYVVAGYAELTEMEKLQSTIKVLIQQEIVENLQSTIKDVIQQEIGNFKDEILGAIDSIGSELKRQKEHTILDEKQQNGGNSEITVHSDDTKTTIGEVIGVINDGETVMMYNIAAKGYRLSKLLGITRTTVKEELFEKIYPCKALQGNLSLDVTCIKLITYSGSWETHHRKCLEVGGSGLLEITEDRLPLLQHYLKRVDGFVMWIGGRANEEGRFKWPSGTNVSLSWGWSDDKQRYPEGNEGCMMISHHGEGTFKDENCSSTIGHSLCEMTHATDEITSKDLEITANSDQIEKEFEHTSCGGNSTNGIIRHPSSGGNYQNNEHCSWIIRDEAPITITFVSFATEEGYDYVSIRDGESIRSHLLGNFTGGLVPRSVQTRTNIAHVVFTSDNTGNGAGFELHWEPTACGGEYNSSSGVIRHPYFSGGTYNYDQDCIWIIRAANPISITFISFNIVEGDDYLYVRDGEQIESHVLGKFTGNVVPSPVQTFANAAHLLLNALSNDTGGAFELHWEPSDPCMESFFNLDGQCIKLVTKEGSWDKHHAECLKLGGSQLMEITEDRLHLLQPYLKRIYDTSHTTEVEGSALPSKLTTDSNDPMDTTGYVAWIGGRKNKAGRFQWPSGKDVSLAWGWSSGEPNNVGGNEDYCMAIVFRGTFNGSPCSSPLGHSLCEMLPYSHLSKEFGTTRTLTTNMSLCGGEYNSTSGMIRHPLNGGSYQNNEQCTWIIRGPVFIALTFVSFSTEEGYDYLSVRNGESIDSHVLGNFSGDSLPSSVQTSTMAAHLHFTSDYNRKGVGFELHWKHSTCGDYNSSSGMIRHPFSGGNYQNHDHCIWIIRAAEPIIITFVSFNTEGYSDELTVRDGETPGSVVLRRLRGDKVPDPVLPKSNSAHLSFRSDHRGTRTGFELHWEPSGCGGEYNSSSGMIRYPLSGDKYQDYENCIWIIRATDPITITFDRFYTEDNSDYLYVRDGESIGSRVLGNFSGYRDPSPVQTSTNAAYLLFTSDVSSTRTGFELHWELSEMK